MRAEGDHATIELETRRRASFMLRVWTEFSGLEQSPPDIRCFLLSVSTGDGRYFPTLEEALVYIREYLLTEAPEADVERSSDAMGMWLGSPRMG